MATILIVDDDKDVLELVRFLADREGYKLVTAEDGKEGIEMAVREKPDLVIMDIMLPELDGHSATLELSRQEATHHIPIIVLTAKSNMRSAFELTPNVIAYIEKPFDPKQLSDLVRKSLADRAS